MYACNKAEVGIRVHGKRWTFAGGLVTSLIIEFEYEYVL